MPYHPTSVLTATFAPRAESNTGRDTIGNGLCESAHETPQVSRERQRAIAKVSRWRALRQPRIGLFFALAALTFVLPGPVLADPARQFEQISLVFEELDMAETAVEIREAVEQLSPDQLERIYGEVDFSPITERLRMLAPEFVRSVREVEAAELRLAEAAGEWAGFVLEHGVSLGGQASGREARVACQETLATEAACQEAKGSWEAGRCNCWGPNIDLPAAPALCDAWPGQNDSKNAAQGHSDSINHLALYRAAQLELQIGQGVWNAASRACEETVVVFGEGGNGSVGCIPADLTFTALQTVSNLAQYTLELGRMHQELKDYCDSAVDTSRLNANFHRLINVRDELPQLEKRIEDKIDARFNELKALVDLVIAGQVEKSLQRGSGPRMALMYGEDGLKRVYEQLAAAIAETEKLYGPEYKISKAKVLMASCAPRSGGSPHPDPKAAFDACRKGYEIVTKAKIKLDSPNPRGD